MDHIYLLSAHYLICHCASEQSDLTQILNNEYGSKSKLAEQTDSRIMHLQKTTLAFLASRFYLVLDLLSAVKSKYILSRSAAVDNKTL